MSPLLSLALFLGVRAAPVARYEVQVAPHGEELRVTLVLSPAERVRLAAEGEHFIDGIERATATGWAPQQAGDAPRCAAGCRFRYRVRLGEAARALEDPELAAEVGEGIVSAMDFWLLRNEAEPTEARLRVQPAPGEVFAAGLPEDSGDASTVRLDRTIQNLPLAAFGRWALQSVDVGGARLRLAVPPAGLTMNGPSVLRWVREGADVVVSAYRHFPLPVALLVVSPEQGHQFSGKTLGSSVLLRVGHDASEAAARGDWVLVHELLHLAQPSVRERWLQEGLSTYQEPILRARAGLVPAEAVWADLVRSLPKGLPGATDRGLDGTHSWGRTYWGGALFCLLADVEIRKAPGNRRSLDDALRAVVDAGGTAVARWDIARWLRVGDAATGTEVLTTLHARMGPHPYTPDLDALWRQLGVEAAGRSVRFDDSAPLADIRRAITAPSALRGQP